MMEAGLDGDFPVEPLGSQSHAQLGIQDLDGNRAVVFQVVGPVNRRHTTPPNLRFDGITIGQCLLKTTEWKELAQPINPRKEDRPSDIPQ